MLGASVAFACFTSISSCNTRTRVFLGSQPLPDRQSLPFWWGSRPPLASESPHPKGWSRGSLRPQEFRPPVPAAAVCGARVAVARGLCTGSPPLQGGGDPAVSMSLAVAQSPSVTREASPRGDAPSSRAHRRLPGPAVWVACESLREAVCQLRRGPARPEFPPVHGRVPHAVRVFTSEVAAFLSPPRALGKMRASRGEAVKLPGRQRSPLGRSPASQVPSLVFVSCASFRKFTFLEPQFSVGRGQVTKCCPLNPGPGR